MRPWSYAFTIIGGLAFASGIIGEYSASPNPPMVAVIVAGLLNPIFFIGFPLGIYWLRRSKKSHPPAAIASDKPDSTVPCEEQEQPCTVNRTDDALHWYHTTGGLLTILTTCICICITAGIFFGGPSLGPDEEANNFGTSFFKGEACIEKREYDEGIAHFTEAIRLNPNYSLFYDERARAYLLKHEYDQAVVDATAAIRINPLGDCEAYCLRACAYYEKGDYAQAINDTTKAIRDHPEDAKPFGIRADAYRMMKYYAQAISDATEAIRLDPLDAWVVYATRADAYRMMNDFDKAVADATVAIRSHKTNLLAYIVRGRVFRQRGDFDSAILDLSQAVQLDPSNQALRAELKMAISRTAN